MKSFLIAIVIIMSASMGMQIYSKYVARPVEYVEIEQAFQKEVIPENTYNQEEVYNKIAELEENLNEEENMLEDEATNDEYLDMNMSGDLDLELQTATERELDEIEAMEAMAETSEKELELMNNLENDEDYADFSGDEFVLEDMPEELETEISMGENPEIKTTKIEKSVSIQESPVEEVLEDKENITIKPENIKEIAIIITDVSDENIKSVMKYIPNRNIGLSFDYGSFDSMKEAKDNGYNQIIASIVMEPLNEKIFLPASSIKTSNTSEKNINILNSMLKQSYMPIAIMNNMGSKVTSKKHINTLAPIMQELNLKNLGFVDSKSNYYSVAGEIAKKYGVPYVENFIFLDKDRTEAGIKKNLELLKERAKNKGYALGAGDYSAKYIKILSEWIETLGPEYQIVPITTLMEK